MVVFLIEIELIPFFFVFLYPNYASMTGQEIVKRPIERNGRVTEDFFVKCEPLFCSIMNIVFNHEVEYDELVNKLYIRREELQEEIVENAYDVWAEARKKEGWKYDKKRDDSNKFHPDLIPSTAHPNSEKEYNRIMAFKTIKLVKKLGYDIVKRNQ